MDAYPLSHLHAIASADPAILFEHTRHLEDKHQPRIRPAPPSTRSPPRGLWPARRGLTKGAESCSSSSCFSSTPSVATDDSAWLELQREEEQRPGRREVAGDSEVRRNLQQLLRQLNTNRQAATRAAGKTTRATTRRQQKQRRTVRSFTARLQAKAKRPAPSTAAAALAPATAAAAAATTSALGQSAEWWATQGWTATTTFRPAQSQETQWQPAVPAASTFSMQPHRPQPPPSSSPSSSMRRSRSGGQSQQQRPGRAIKPAVGTASSPRTQSDHRNLGGGTLSSSDDDSDDDDSDDDGCLVRLVEAISPATSPRTRTTQQRQPRHGQPTDPSPRTVFSPSAPSSRRGDPSPRGSVHALARREPSADSRTPPRQLSWQQFIR